MRGSASDKVARFEAFLSEFQALLKRVEAARPAPISRTEAKEFLESFNKAWELFLERNEQNPPFINIWKESGLDRDEVKNCRVLCWLLNPQGSHLQDTRFLRCFLEQIRVPVAQDAVGKPHVKREVSVPDREGNCRLDIIVEGETYFLCIEAKIGMREDSGQLAKEAEGVKKSGRLEGRIFIGKYLTPNGRSGEVVSEDFTRVLWRDVASALARFAGVNGGDDGLAATSRLVREIAWQYAQFIMSEIYGELAFPVYRR